jgi:hypothetical protein
MEFALHALSPLDGRYARTTQPLSPYFSEFGLIAYRVRVEVEYFIALAELPLPALAGISEEQKDALRALYAEFSEADALEIKRIEKTTNHDVKAVEYFLKDQMTRLGLAEQSEYIHFGLTSQDINNTTKKFSCLRWRICSTPSGTKPMLGPTFPCSPEPTGNPHPPPDWAKNGRFSLCAWSSNAIC